MRKKRKVAKHRRRRSNPTPIVFANPRRKRHGRRRRRGKMHRRRSASLVRGSFHTNRANPRRRRRHLHRGHAHARHHHRLHRRSNPYRHRLSSFMGLIRIGAFGAAGIVVARVSGYYYDQYAAKHVVGDKGEDWRKTLNEAVRLAAMEVGVIVGERVLRSVRIAGPVDCVAFVIGGTAEVARQAVGVLIKHTSPETKLDKYGLNGMGAAPAFEDQQGNIYVFDEQLGGYRLHSSRQQPQLSGLEPADAFEGLEPEDTFEGLGYGYGGEPVMPAM